MKKQSLIIAIIIILICVVYSGCTETKNEITPANTILKSVSYLPINPVENENFTFFITLYNSGDTNDSVIIHICCKNDLTLDYSIRSSAFQVNAHSEKTISMKTNENVLSTGKINEGLQTFSITMFGYETNDRFIEIGTVDIYIQPSPPEIYLATTASNVVTFGNYTEKTTFSRGEIVYVYFEFKNVDHTGTTDIFQSIVINHKDSWVKYGDYYDDFKQISENTLWYMYRWFQTNVNWPLGTYQVDIGLQDKFSGLTATKTIYFTLT